MQNNSKQTSASIIIDLSNPNLDSNTVMKNKNNIEIGDTVYLFETDPKCETVYEVVNTHADGRVVLYHPIKLETEAYTDELKPSIH